MICVVFVWAIRTCVQFTHKLCLLPAYRLSALHAKTDELESALADTNAVKASTEAFAEEILDLRQQVDQLHVERVEALKRAEESAAAAAALQVDVESSREEAEAAIREAAAADAAAEELRATAEGLRRTVGEYRSKETEVYSSINEAVEAAEQVLRDAPPCLTISLRPLPWSCDVFWLPCVTTTRRQGTIA